MVRNIVESIRTFNAERDPELVALKYRAMRHDPFAFYRGTCHLFYEDWRKGSALNAAPHVWVSGDLHLGNFGCYKGDNRLVYFDVNDFDEAVLAPCTWDLARLLTSLLVGMGSIGAGKSEALQLAERLLKIYTRTLAAGQIARVERDTVKGAVGDLFQALKQRKRKAFLDSHAPKKDGKRKLHLDRVHFLGVSPTQCGMVEAALKHWQTRHSTTFRDKYPRFFTVIDVARRIAGVGSLGIERYAVLVEGKGSPDRNFLLELKAAGQSSLTPYLTVPQPEWSNQAERVVEIQKRFQGIPPALLSWVKLEGQPFLLREMQPYEDRVDLPTLKGEARRRSQLMGTLGRTVAWGQLRSAGRKGSAIADDLIRFAQGNRWHAPLLAYAQAYADQIESDFSIFSSAYDAGKFGQSTVVS
ncbi:MAG TPA: DUF2252 family protein [Aggregatilineales bacterium]|nr:DUF2252 family protein [Aggregatilineales bacterium]